jgi:hypothetical protein
MCQRIIAAAAVARSATSDFISEFQRQTDTRHNIMLSRVRAILPRVSKDFRPSIEMWLEVGRGGNRQSVLR